jgi:hypothetical protein
VGVVDARSVRLQVLGPRRPGGVGEGTDEHLAVLRHAVLPRRDVVERLVCSAAPLAAVPDRADPVALHRTSHRPLSPLPVQALAFV